MIEIAPGRITKTLSIFFLVGALTTVTGCSSFNPWDLVYPKESGEEVLPGPPTDGKITKARFSAVLDDTAVFIGGTWESGLVGTPTWCGPEAGKNDGYIYRVSWKRTEIAENPEAVTKSTIKHWKEQGYKITTETWHNGTQVVRISSKNGDDYWLQNDKGELTLGGNSGCYPGNWVDIRNNEYDEQDRLHPTETPTTQPSP